MERDVGCPDGCRCCGNFNSHAHVERDDRMLERRKQLGNFNSHAHVERDDVLLSRALGGLNFNSHAHVERDATFLKLFSFFRISTHTLTWSVTTAKKNIFCLKRISTHTLTWSVTAHAITLAALAAFQLTRSRGA